MKHSLSVILVCLLSVGFIGCGGGRVGVKPESQPVDGNGKTEVMDANEAESQQLKPGPDPRYVSPELHTIYFDYDNSSVRTDQKATILDNVSAMKSDFKYNSVVLEGHADERGSTEYNLALGERRAISVRDALIADGIDASRLFVVSKGEEMPADPGHSEEAFAKNRRVEFWLVEPEK